MLDTGVLLRGFDCPSGEHLSFEDDVDDKNGSPEPAGEPG